MALSLRTLALRQTITATRAQTVPVLIRTFTTSSILQKDDEPAYPFTKREAKPAEPANPSHRAAAANINYPFTNDPNPSSRGSQPAPEATYVSPPNRPMMRSSSGSSPEKSTEGTQHSAELQPQDDLPHQPDYNVASDYRTSAYSPIPMRVMDGSEPSDVTPAAVLSGAPTELQARTVRIFQPTKTATQSGDWHGHHWQMDWDVLGKGHRWENPLMGWQSSGDFMQATKLNFKTKDDAIRFAEEQGYEYYVQEPNERRGIPKAYASQFMHRPKKLKTIRTK